MTNFNEWLTQLKTEKPQLNDFITKVEPLFSDNGFEIAKFEKAMAAGIKKVETDITEIQKKQNDAQG